MAMGIDELERAFLDIDFQANRIAKSKKIDPEQLYKFILRAEQVREQLLQMGLHADLHLSLEQAAPIDQNYIPTYNFGKKLINIILVGQHKKRYIPKQQDAYFRGEVAQIKRLFSYAKGQLSLD